MEATHCSSSSSSNMLADSLDINNDLFFISPSGKSLSAKIKLVSPTYMGRSPELAVAKEEVSVKDATRSAKIKTGLNISPLSAKALKQQLHRQYFKKQHQHHQQQCHEPKTPQALRRRQSFAVSKLLADVSETVSETTLFSPIQQRTSPRRTSILRSGRKSILKKSTVKKSLGGSHVGSTLTFTGGPITAPGVSFKKPATVSRIPVSRKNIKDIFSSHFSSSAAAGAKSSMPISRKGGDVFADCHLSEPTPGKKVTGMLSLLGPGSSSATNTSTDTDGPITVCLLDESIDYDNCGTTDFPITKRLSGRLSAAGDEQRRLSGGRASFGSAGANNNNSSSKQRRALGNNALDISPTVVTTSSSSNNSKTPPPPSSSAATSRIHAIILNHSTCKDPIQSTPQIAVEDHIDEENCYYNSENFLCGPDASPRPTVQTPYSVHKPHHHQQQQQSNVPVQCPPLSPRRESMSNIAEQLAGLTHSPRLGLGLASGGLSLLSSSLSASKFNPYYYSAASSAPPAVTLSAQKVAGILKSAKRNSVSSMQRRVSLSADVFSDAVTAVNNNNNDDHSIPADLSPIMASFSSSNSVQKSKVEANESTSNSNSNSSPMNGQQDVPEEVHHSSGGGSESESDSDSSPACELFANWEETSIEEVLRSPKRSPVPARCTSAAAAAAECENTPQACAKTSAAVLAVLAATPFKDHLEEASDCDTTIPEAGKSTEKKSLRYSSSSSASLVGDSNPAAAAAAASPPSTTLYSPAGDSSHFNTAERVQTILPTSGVSTSSAAVANGELSPEEKRIVASIFLASPLPTATHAHIISTAAATTTATTTISPFSSSPRRRQSSLSAAKSKKAVSSSRKSVSKLIVNSSSSSSPYRSPIAASAVSTSLSTVPHPLTEHVSIAPSVPSPSPFMSPAVCAALSCVAAAATATGQRTPIQHKQARSSIVSDTKASPRSHLVAAEAGQLSSPRRASVAMSNSTSNSNSTSSAKRNILLSSPRSASTSSSSAAYKAVRTSVAAVVPSSASGNGSSSSSTTSARKALVGVGGSGTASSRASLVSSPRGSLLTTSKSVSSPRSPRATTIHSSSSSSSISSVAKSLFSPSCKSPRHSSLKTIPTSASASAPVTPNSSRRVSVAAATTAASMAQRSATKKAAAITTPVSASSKRVSIMSSATKKSINNPIRSSSNSNSTPLGDINKTTPMKTAVSSISSPRAALVAKCASTSSVPYRGGTGPFVSSAKKLSKVQMMAAKFGGAVSRPTAGGVVAHAASAKSHHIRISHSTAGALLDDAPPPVTAVVANTTSGAPVASHDHGEEEKEMMAKPNAFASLLAPGVQMEAPKISVDSDVAESRSSSTNASSSSRNSTAEKMQQEETTNFIIVATPDATSSKLTSTTGGRRKSLRIAAAAAVTAPSPPAVNSPSASTEVLIADENTKPNISSIITSSSASKPSSKAIDINVLRSAAKKTQDHFSDVLCHEGGAPGTGVKRNARRRRDSYVRKLVDSCEDVLGEINAAL